VRRLGPLPSRTGSELASGSLLELSQSTVDRWPDLASLMAILRFNF
jgi:hypothetical protein